LQKKADAFEDEARRLAEGWRLAEEVATKKMEVAKKKMEVTEEQVRETKRERER